MSNKMIINAISAALAMSLTGSTAAATEGEKMMQASPVKGVEKCFGVVKAGMNDCGNASHQCGGEAKKDSSKKEWVLMPTGLCQRIVGGSTLPSKQ